MARLVSVNVGLPKDVAWQGHTVHTGIWKQPVTGRRMVRRLNIDGDGQGDLDGHGGEQRAVLVYQLDSHRHWQDHFGWDAVQFGLFGENLTVDGLADDEVCIGDRYRIGEAEFEVTQPRVTCFRVGLRVGQPELPALLVAHHRPGFYLRVITEGYVEAGDDIVRTRVGPHALSVADIDALLYLPNRDVDRLRRAVDVPALSPGWQQSFRDLLAQVAAGGPAEGPRAGAEPGWPGFRRLRVTGVVAESSTVSSICLVPDDGERLSRPRAGQYITVRASEAGDPAPARSYSLSSDPGAEEYRITVKREPYGVMSRYLHAHLQAGSVLDVAAPRGEFVLDDDATPLLLLSAGIGVTPVLAMLHQLADARSTRPIWWVQVVRDAGEHAFASESRRLLDALGDAHERVFYTSPEADVPATGRVTRGRPTAAALAELGLPTDATAYICGPIAFMTEMTDALVSLGIAPARVHTELFGARSAINPGVTDVRRVTPHPPPGPPGTGPLVTFARSGLTLRWPAAQRTLLELADACEVPTRWSCRTGVCHTCVTPLLSGAVAYSPEPLEPPGPGEVLICCSRPQSDVVLDL
ncbi:MAG: MOSC domain-containing protein [Actinomycetales bacterium]